MGYLITQILIYLVLAAIIGFLVAWVSRGSRLGSRIESLENELWTLRANTPVQSPPAARADDSALVQALRGELSEVKRECEQCRRELDAARASAARVGASPPPSNAPQVSEPPPARSAPPVSAMSGEAPAASVTASAGGAQPVALDAPHGTPDELQRIKGIGPKIEGILHSLGVFHFHQIAAWTSDNVEWVNDHLRFKGRIEREQWIAQAKSFVSE